MQVFVANKYITNTDTGTRTPNVLAKASFKNCFISLALSISRILYPIKIIAKTPPIVCLNRIAKPYEHS